MRGTDNYSGSVKNGNIAYVSSIATAQHREVTRVGNIVQCNFRFTVPSGAGSGFTIGTIPNGYRPNVEIAFSAFQAWQKDGNVPIVIETSGVVRFLNTLFTVGQSYYLCATWITADELPQ